MPVTNIVIVLFLLTMMYWGTVQGLFSSFLHLMLVIAVGSIAFALWEPITLWLLMKYLPIWAWTVGLLVPFALLLLIFRMVADKLVPTDMNFLPIVNTVFGAACGLFSGILTAGIAIIGLGFLPFGTAMGGFQPYSVGSGGVVQETGNKLWVPVNTMAWNVYSGLSGGPFSTRTPMVEYMPRLDVQMSLLRYRLENISIVASPKAVDVTGAAIADTASLKEVIDPATADALGPDFKRPGYKLVVIDTEWSKVEGTVDGDRALRLPASHIQLVARSNDPDRETFELVGAIGFVKHKGDSRVYYPFNSDGDIAFATALPSSFSWVFLLRDDQQPRFPIIRKLRLELPGEDQIKTSPEEVLAALGTPLAPKPEGGDETAGAGPGGDQRGPTVIGDRTGRAGGTIAEGLEITSKLPIAISKNASSGLSFTTNSKGETLIDSGTGSSRKTSGTIGKRSRVSGFDIPDHEAMVRIRIDSDHGNSLFGKAMSLATEINPIFLKDSDGQMYYPTAWVWKKESKDQDIHYDPFNPIRSAKQMPINRMNKGDEFYLYFTVTRPEPGAKPVELVSYNIGDVSDQPFEPPLLIK
jgi:hypothetical protein